MAVFQESVAAPVGALSAVLCLAVGLEAVRLARLEVLVPGWSVVVQQVALDRQVLDSAQVVRVVLQGALVPMVGLSQADSADQHLEPSDIHCKEASNGVQTALARAVVSASVILVGTEVHTAMAVDILAASEAVMKACTTAASAAASPAALAVVLAAATEAASARLAAAVAHLGLLSGLQGRLVLPAQAPGGDDAHRCWGRHGTKESGDWYHLLRRKSVKHASSTFYPYGRSAT